MVVPVAIDFSSILGPSWGPRWLQNRSKIDPKSSSKIYKFSNRFLINFFLILDRFLTPSGSQNRSKFDQQINTTTQQSKNKNLKKPCVFSIQSCPRPCWIMLKNRSKSNQHPSKNRSQNNAQVGSILEPTWLHFGTVLGTKIAFKIDSKLI